MGAPKTDFIVVGLESVPPSVTRDVIFRNGLAFVVLNPLSPVLWTPRVRSLAILAESWRSRPNTSLGFTLVWLQVGVTILWSTSSWTARISVPPASSRLFLCGSCVGDQRRTHGAIRYERSQKAWRFPAQYSVQTHGAVQGYRAEGSHLTSGNLPTDIAALWQLFFKRLNLWTGTGPFSVARFA